MCRAVCGRARARCRPAGARPQIDFSVSTRRRRFAIRSVNRCTSSLRNDYGRTLQVPTDQRLTDSPENDSRRTMQVPTDQRMTDSPNWVVPPDVPTALDDSGDGADGRDQEEHMSVEARGAFHCLPPRAKTSNLQERALTARPLSKPGSGRMTSVASASPSSRAESRARAGHQRRRRRSVAEMSQARSRLSASTTDLISAATSS